MEFDPKTGHAIPPYEGWAPFCLKCSTMLRMFETEFGWKCLICKNEINKDLTHHCQNNQGEQNGTSSNPC